MNSYKQYCGVARALDLVGQRWTLLLVRELMPGPRRFTDLLLPGLTPNLLSQRLKELAAAGLIVQIQLPPPAARQVWCLTEQGARLRPVVLALGTFGAAYMGHPGTDTTNVRWLMVSLERRYRGGLGDGEIEVYAGEVPYALRVAEGGLTARDGRSHEARVVVRGGLPSLAALFVRGQVLPDLELRGDPEWIRRLPTAFGQG